MRLTFSYFALGTHAASAEVKMLGLSINGQGNRMDIRQPGAPSTPLGMTNIISELWCFTTDVALQF